MFITITIYHHHVYQDRDKIKLFGKTICSMNEEDENNAQHIFNVVGHQTLFIRLMSTAYKYNCPVFHSGAPGAGEREAELLLLQVQPQADVHEGAEGPAVGVPATAAADLHRLPADPPAEARYGAGQPPHPHPLPEDRAQLQGWPLAKY